MRHFPVIMPFETGQRRLVVRQGASQCGTAHNVTRHVCSGGAGATAIKLVWLLASFLASSVHCDARSLTQGVKCCDPAVIALPSGKAVYAFGTGDELPFWRSMELGEWERVGSVFPKGVPAWAVTKVPETRGFWAPDISFFNGLYHVYYSVSSWGSQRSVIGLAVGKSLDPDVSDYGWHDWGLVVESAPGKTDFNAIDPALFVDKGGTPYLFWGSFWSGIKAARIDPRTGKLAGKTEFIRVAGRAPGTHPPSIEAPYVIRHGDDYYLFVSWGLTCKGKQSTYRVMVGRSKEVMGPYVDFNGTPMIDGGGTLVVSSHDRHYGPGHNSVLQTRRGDWLFHHVEAGERTRWARLLQIRPIFWLAGWPIVGEPWTEASARPRPRTTANAFGGTWSHSVDYGASRKVAFDQDGAVLGSDGRWSYEKGCVVVRWPDKEAPGGAWVDRAILGAHGNTYVGRNQRGQVIRGVRE